jgi:hypothetical protein
MQVVGAGVQSGEMVHDVPHLAFKKHLGHIWKRKLIWLKTDMVEVDKMVVTYLRMTHTAPIIAVVLVAFNVIWGDKAHTEDEY